MIRNVIVYKKGEKMTISRLQNCQKNSFIDKFILWGLRMNNPNKSIGKHNFAKHLLVFMLITCITSCSLPPHLTSTLTLSCYSVTSLWDATVHATVPLTIVTVATPGTGCKYSHKGKNCINMFY